MSAVNWQSLSRTLIIATSLLSPTAATAQSADAGPSIRVDYRSSSPGCFALATEIVERLRTAGYDVALVRDENTAGFPLHVFRYVTLADEDVGDILRETLGGGIPGDLFDEMHPWGGGDVGSAGDHVLIALYGPSCPVP